MGREGDYVIRPVEKAKKVVVVGGGPAGMETARIAALRGHKVLLMEKEARLGGQLNIASLIP
ncbi:MAG: FAD-dependent oxidoreductase, partial [candidate division Zixibacteria bacterium]|nr:FAD-dependent oxidoreductase [candidate division Zixibacteria bacterium]NIU15083.1 FAD-dependent oxidoreductase [candidate division Zixibacteria bacterium]NIW99909.1 FAD-dependent oxidoreductase [Phycisphaerae bacterium]